MASRNQANFNSVIISSPGKVILHGEHAVVYGKTAIATSVDLRCYILLHPRPSGEIKLMLPGMHMTQVWSLSELNDLTRHSTGEKDEYLTALKTFCNVSDNPSMQSLASLVLLYLLTKILNDKLKSLPGLDILVSSQLPFGAGLGSSAAYSSCLAAGLLTCCGDISVRKEGKSSSEIQWLPIEVKEYLQERGIALDGVGGVSCCGYAGEELDVINKWSYEAEGLVHGTPSGIDNTISVFGGAIKFKSGAFTQIEKMPTLTILLVYTKVPRNTKKMVAGVKYLYDKYPLAVGPILASIEEIVLKSESVLAELSTKQEDSQDLYVTLQELFTINHHLLNAIGVGHSSLDKIHNIALKVGIASKLTGAGGGGCAIALIPPGLASESIAEVRGHLEEAGFDCWETSIGGNGVRTHWIQSLH